MRSGVDGLGDTSRHDAFIGLGSSLRCLGRYEQAAQVLAQGLGHFPGDGAMRAFLAMTRHNLGDSKAAVQDLLVLLTQTSNEASIRDYARALTFYAEDVDKRWDVPLTRSNEAGANAVPQPVEPPKRALDDVIAEHLDAARASGELASAKSWGRPLDLGDGWDDTPAELRMPMKILKDAGIVPYEVTLMRDIDALRRQVDAGAFADDPGGLLAAKQRLAEMRQNLALRLERLRASGRL